MDRLEGFAWVSVVEALVVVVGSLVVDLVVSLVVDAVGSLVAEVVVSLVVLVVVSLAAEVVPLVVEVLEGTLVVEEEEVEGVWVIDKDRDRLEGVLGVDDARVVALLTSGDGEEGVYNPKAFSVGTVDLLLGSLGGTGGASESSGGRGPVVVPSVGTRVADPADGEAKLSGGSQVPGISATGTIQVAVSVTPWPVS